MKNKIANILIVLAVVVFAVAVIEIVIGYGTILQAIEFGVISILIFWAAVVLKYGHYE